MTVVVASNASFIQWKRVISYYDQDIAFQEIEIVKTHLRDIYDALKIIFILSVGLSRKVSINSGLCLCKQEHAKVIYQTRAQDQWKKDLENPQRKVVWMLLDCIASDISMKT